jgi:ubiquinone/menaquinone biosynthesis C-methylase UbiE
MRAQIRDRLLLALALTLLLQWAGAQAPHAQSSLAQQEEAAREAWQKVPEIFEAMAIRPGANVADVGAGDGFLTVRLSRAVGPTGRVMAVDVSARALERLRARVAQEGLTNVDTVKGDTDNPHLPSASLDAAVIVNSYHEMTDYQAMLRHLRSALKPDGRLVIIEPISDKRRDASRDQQVAVHEIAVYFVEQEVREAGFRIRRFQDPFTMRHEVSEWLLAAVPDPLAPALGAICPVPPKTSAPSPSPATDDEAAIANPDLRMAFDTFKKRRAENSIVVVDVRSEDEFLAGHVPGATWIPSNRLTEHIAELRARGKPVVTYCS